MGFLTLLDTAALGFPFYTRFTALQHAAGEKNLLRHKETSN